MTMVGELCTTTPETAKPSTKISSVAETMRDAGIGDVLVVDEDQPVGIVTDRDIVVRVVAEGRDPDRTQVSTVSSDGVVTIPASEGTEAAEELMREHAVRRLPVVSDDGKLVGVVTLADIAAREDPSSTLAHIAKASTDGSAEA